MTGWTEHISKQHIRRPYEYFAKDHLGNVRVVFKPNGRSAMRVQEVHYYPFGLPMPYTHYASSSSTPNRLLYNSKELLNYLPGLRWYDYGARMYDAQVGRWYSVDPHGERYNTMSSYIYGFNSPINVVDPDGRDCIIIINRDEKGNITGVTISSKIYITGPGANKKSADELNRGVGDVFKSQVKSNVKVNFDINYEYSENISQQDLKGGENILSFKNTESTSHVVTETIELSNGNKVKTSGNFGIINQEDWNDNNVIYHETGHLIGLSDRYGENNQAPFPYFDKDLMGNPRQYPILGDVHYQAFLVQAKAYSILHPGTKDTKFYINRFKVDYSLKGKLFPATLIQMKQNPFGSQ